MKIYVTSIFVSDQAQALKFYTEVCGFVKKNDIPLGEYRWLTVISPDQPGGVELLLEPNNNPAAQVFQKAMVDQGIPLTSLAVDSVQSEYDRMSALGVKFTMPPTEMGNVTVAVFDDTCGNLIQIAQLS